MTMLEVFKSKLPVGLEVVNTKERYKEFLIRLQYQNTGTIIHLPKTCVPGDEEYLCEVVLCDVMMSIAIERKDNNMLKLWLEKQRELIFSHHSNSPDGVY